MGKRHDQPLPGHSWNSGKRIEDNSFLVPHYFLWTCLECGEVNNDVEMIECNDCQFVRSIGIVAKGTDCGITWRLTIRDRHGNEYWQLSRLR